MNPKTKLIHYGRGDQNTEVRSVNPTLMRASTIAFKDHATWQKYKTLRKTERVLSYGARGTSTNFELEKLICSLENGHRAQLFPTGLAALAMVLLNYASKNAHFLITDAIYGPVRTICELFLEKIGIEIDFLKADASDIEEKIKPNTKLILCESPGSILYEIIDLPKLCKIAHSHNIPVAIDNTYGSGYYFNPLELGADISVIAATKYLSGHSDVTMGIVIINEKEWKNFDQLPEVLGFTTSPDDAYLVLRGMRTLDVRMKAHEKNADEIIKFLQTRKEIKTLFYPKLKTHPNHEIFMRDYKGANGMITIEFNDAYDEEDAIKFVDALQYFCIGDSWGGYESLATVTTPPRTVTNWSARGPFVRFHIGLEDYKDLITDLIQAFDSIKK
ncbi:PLP-dependent aspartate aminotransferase family protein [Campylobacter sp. VicNov18]|uniref:trans-sulfuration enzyme family protein n=1 Tax=Campylobacter bilis TaxID=2691918 RepID=UPI00130EE819|nr:PLP-dependent aspartate aminotransferase family protein [Campylobacter bilis]MPV64088.1 aminotransferase class I/II-fold pyridoxal phosphate-dependent enzyme [Campylobacter hepaticus]MBM0637591.1 aminotransferase class I/II-fold pyridoxal phosphate-dependent enzyme [Campylobacter bilis]MCC8278317.1 PLP-dependent aspartate aminotransferase family protein [Campylobacter bilis]MCC8299821.1 PLP-dependent aspartate aminotransferase family protein [Campylobacter bilis]MCC8301226.1 PLP-dependent a